MQTDERLLTLLKQRSVRCTLRKQPQDLTEWWYAALKDYSNLWVRPDKDSNPQIRQLLAETFSLLKLVALPNNPERKRARIEEKWPSLKERIDGILI